MSTPSPTTAKTEPEAVKVPAHVLRELSRPIRPDILQLIAALQFAIKLDEAEKSK
jgi:hypothetical protein